MINIDNCEIKISSDVLKIITSIAMEEVEESSKIKKISVIKNDNSYSVNAYIALKYGLDMEKIIMKMQENVINTIKTMTGLKVDKVNIYVYDILLGA